jgi:phosphoadenosine phosphosulfate reductase
MSETATLDVDALAERFATAPAEDVVAWAGDAFGSDLVVLTAMTTDVVLVDLVARRAPQAEVVFLDTAHHFPETLAFLAMVRERYPHVRITVEGPDLPAADMWQTDPDQCCHLRKVIPMERALAGRPGWVSGMRRVDAVTRTELPVVQRDRRGLVKVNPLANWTDDDLATFVALHDVPQHPLLAEGYLSIGCAPCTRKVAPGEHPRAGRWAGQGKTECGLHL